MDDEEFCISALELILHKLGVYIDTQVDFCISGQEAVDQVKKVYDYGLSYKLIITDFNMPIMDGIQATYEIRKYLEQERAIERKDQPLIVGITGHVHNQFKKDGYKAGMDKIMAKPCYQ